MSSEIESVEPEYIILPVCHACLATKKIKINNEIYCYHSKTKKILKRCKEYTEQDPNYDETVGNVIGDILAK